MTEIPPVYSEPPGGRPGVPFQPAHTDGYVPPAFAGETHDPGDSERCQNPACSTRGRASFEFLHTLHRLWLRGCDACAPTICAPWSGAIWRSLPSAPPQPQAAPAPTPQPQAPPQPQSVEPKRENLISWLLKP